MSSTFHAFLPIVPQAATAQNKRAMSLPGKGGIRFFHTKAHQQAMDALAKALAPHRPPSAFVGPLELWLTLVFPYRKTEKAAIRHAGKLIPHTTRPDIDNLAKGYIDALMHARILAEDGLVAAMHLSKWWGPEDFVGITYRLAPCNYYGRQPLFLGCSDCS